MYEGGEIKNPTRRGVPAERKIPPAGMAASPSEGGHDLAREPAQLLLELLRGQALGPMDHEVLEPGILRLDGLDPFDDVRRWATEQRLLLATVGEVRRA